MLGDSETVDPVLGSTLSGTVSPRSPENRVWGFSSNGSFVKQSSQFSSCVRSRIIPHRDKQSVRERVCSRNGSVLGSYGRTETLRDSPLS